VQFDRSKSAYHSRNTAVFAIQTALKLRTKVPGKVDLVLQFTRILHFCTLCILPFCWVVRKQIGHRIAASPAAPSLAAGPSREIELSKINFPAMLNSPANAHGGH
jgi:hypothetical protein